MVSLVVKKVVKLMSILPVAAWRGALWRFRVAAGVEHEVVLRQLDNCQSVVDIGANRGQFALVARHCFKQADIYSFEPLPGPASVYRTVFERDPRVTLYETAIGPVSGDATIHLSARDDSSSLLPITSRQNDLFPGTSEAGTTTIRVSRLTDEMNEGDLIAPALLKLDVQGFELSALNGCEDVLNRFKWIYVECSFVELYAGQALADAVIAWLRVRSFTLQGVYNMAYDDTGRAIQADFLFEHTLGEVQY